MTPASSPLLRAIGIRLVAAFAAAGETCPWSVNPSAKRSMPYGVLGSDTETAGFSTKTCDGSIMTHTLRIYSKSDALSRRLARIAIKDLTDRDNPLTIEDIDDGDTVFYQANRTILEMNEIIQDRDESGDIFGAAIRFRFLIGQYTE